MADGSAPRRQAWLQARVVVGIVWVTSAAVLAVAPGGCAKPLLSPGDVRTPYDPYDAVRNQRAPQYIEDEFGQRRPNLRGRLAPKR